WHGAAWHFVVWGGLHGVYLAVGHWKDGKREAGLLAEPPDTLLVHWMQRLATFTLVCIAWTLFRADSVATALALLARTGTAWRLPSPLVTTSGPTTLPTACLRAGGACPPGGSSWSS